MYRAFLQIVFVLFPVLLMGKGPVPNMAGRNPAVSGYVKDAETGEVLIGATVYVSDKQGGTATNTYGFYSLSMPNGKYTLTFAYLGYQTLEKVIDLKADMTLNIDLVPEVSELNEVKVTAKKAEENVESAQMGVEKLQSKTIKEVPALMGEIDPIKVLQLLPGVQAASEGSSGFSVRGGNPDQNLLLLDEAIVYNAGHMMGFFSVFNNDAIKDVKLYKGDIPAAYGGRLSSLIDIRMKDGNNKKISGTGGIGLISSRLTLEGPIASEKTTFLVSGRRTYADLFFPLSSQEAVKSSRLFFYDFNAKLSHVIGEKDRIYASGYFGRDVFKNAGNQMDFGNKTFTLRWNHLYNARLFSNLTLIGSNYDYKLVGGDTQADGFAWDSKLKDYSAKLDFNYYPNVNNAVTFGVQSIFHDIMPGYARGTGDSSMYNQLKLPNSYSLEHAVYVENTQKLSSRLKLRYGLRFSAFQNLGKAVLYHYDSNYEVAGEENIPSGEIYNTYFSWEPRLGATYLLTASSSLKASYSRTAQYLHLASNSTSGMPLDVWFASSPNVKPQQCDQFAAGWFKNVSNNAIELSVEAFYKNMQHSIDFKDYANLLLNEQMEGELRFGKAYAYGAELMTRYNFPRWNGWVSYTYSRSQRKTEGIVNNEWYNSPYDHPHDISIVVNHLVSKRVTVSANWVYYTGTPTTYPVGRSEIGGTIVPIYSSRNAERMPDYHRLDLGCTVRGKEKAGQKWQGEWVFSLYNAYARHNAWTISFIPDKDEPYKTVAEKTYLFAFVPSVTYNFKF
jgi:hypothetical protein